MCENSRQCYICLKEQSDISLLYTKITAEDIATQYLSKLIEEISGVEITLKFGQEIIICNECAKAILDADNIIKKCRESHKRWEAMEEQKLLELVRNEKYKRKSNAIESSNYSDAEGGEENSSDAVSPDDDDDFPIGGGDEDNNDDDNNTTSEDDSDDDYYDREDAQSRAQRVKASENDPITKRYRKFMNTRNTNKDHYFSCEQCSYKTISATYFRQHMDEEHKVDRNAKIFRCLQCPQRFTKNHNLQTHMARMHENREVQHNYLCSECGRTFARGHNLKAHQKTHIPNRERQIYNTVRCEYCNKMYKKTSIRIHIESMHTKEKTITCNICNAAFALNKGLQAHMRTCHPTTTFRCPSCGAMFRVKYAYQMHMKRGFCKESDYKFNCDYCAWGFKTSSRLEKHVVSVHKKILERNLETDAGTSFENEVFAASVS